MSPRELKAEVACLYSGFPLWSVVDCDKSIQGMWSVNIFFESRLRSVHEMKQAKKKGV